MDKRNAYITNKSIEQSGLPSDFKKALSEYIWNGFDAGATTVNLDFESNAVGFINTFSISDNGSGIDMATVDDTFGQFLDSQKSAYPNKKRFVKGRKGKGRYAFSTFANNCNWLTTYAGPDGKNLQYNIIINKGDLQHFGTVNNVIAQYSKTGTIVTFSDFFALNGDLLSTKEFVDYLASEFGWYLYLNRIDDYKIFINGESLTYESMVGHAESYQHAIGKYQFQIDFVRWNQRIGDKYYFYFLNEKQKETHRKYTSFNNRAIDYHHSVYVTSTYFNDFQETLDDSPVLPFSGKNQADPNFRTLVKDLTDIVTAQEKEFIRHVQADKLLRDFEEAGALPLFDESENDQVRRQDLKDVIRELYCAEPRLFHGLNNHQKKGLIRFLDLLLATDRRVQILDVIAGFVELSEEERERLAIALK